MAAYNGKSRAYKDALIVLLSGITYNTDDSEPQPAFTTVVGRTRRDDDGYPIVSVLPADLSTQKAAVYTNDKTVNFFLRTYLPMEDGPEGENATYDHMYDLTDLIIDTLDIADYNRSIATINPELTEWILNATRGNWGVVQTDAGVALRCDVDVQFKYSKDLR